MMIEGDLHKILERQHYKLVGGHSAVKLCQWTKYSIMGKGECYKQKFYGIQSHRCLQMTPAVAWCTHRCVFCWRNVEQTLGSEIEKIDEPKDIVDGCIKAQNKLLDGYGGVPKADQKKLAEARKPNQAAISLAGEPATYPKIDGLIGELNGRGFTTFLVTNGTLPERIENLENLPTQLYMSLVAPNKKIYRDVCAPVSTSLWDKINQTLELFPSLDTKKALRITAVRGFNMGHEEEYASLIEKANPDYVEVKAYMFVGGSRKRLTLENMPSFPEVYGFAERLATLTGYTLADHKRDSRVVLLSKK